MYKKVDSALQYTKALTGKHITPLRSINEAKQIAERLDYLKNGLIQ